MLNPFIYFKISFLWIAPLHLYLGPIQGLCCLYKSGQVFENLGAFFKAREGGIFDQGFGKFGNFMVMLNK